MKITSIRVTHVNVPFDAPFWWTAGLYPGASKSIVEVETDEGIVAACEAMGKDFWCYSNDLGIMTAAYLHLRAATQWVTEPSQSLFRRQIGDVVEGGSFRQTGNTIRVPEGPGLGVTLDPGSMARWHKHFVESGPMSHFHHPGNPDRYTRLPLG